MRNSILLEPIKWALALGIAAVIMISSPTTCGAEDLASDSSDISAGAGSAITKPKRSRLSKKVSFTDLKLKGRLKKPDLSYIYKRRGLRSEKIVNIPENFDDEINQGASRF